VVDTGVFGADLVPGSELSDLYEPILRGRPVFISFQTVAELRYGARRRGWGDLRLRQLEARIGEAEIVCTPGPSSSRRMSICASRAHVQGTHSPVGRTKRTGGSRQRRTVSGSHSSLTTGSSAALPASTL